jgi:membrane protein implicated in regulation of membrane protease activity
LCCTGLGPDLDAAALIAVDQQILLRSSTASISKITILLVCWAIVLTIAISIMTVLIVWRMRSLRARAHRLASRATGEALVGRLAVCDVDTEKRTMKAASDSGECRWNCGVPKRGFKLPNNCAR